MFSSIDAYEKSKKLLKNFSSSYYWLFLVILNIKMTNIKTSFLFFKKKKKPRQCIVTFFWLMTSTLGLWNFVTCIGTIGGVRTKLSLETYFQSRTTKNSYFLRQQKGKKKKMSFFLKKRKKGEIYFDFGQDKERKLSLWTWLHFWASLKGNYGFKWDITIFLS